MTDAILWKLFNEFDPDGNQTISAENIRRAFARMGNKISFKDAEAIIKENAF